MPHKTWNEMKRAREEEYFLKEEREKIRAHKAKRDEARAFLARTHDVINNFERGFSPISGGSMFRAYIGDDVVLDCPEEGTLTLPYDTLEKLLKTAGNPESDLLEKWRQYLSIAMESQEEKSA